MQADSSGFSGTDGAEHVSRMGCGAECLEATTSQGLSSPAEALSGRAQGMVATMLVLLVLFSAGCSSWRKSPVPGRTVLDTPLVAVPATTIGHTLFVEVRGDRNRTWRFMVDTGSSVTLVSPEFANQHATDLPATNAPQVRVRSATGQATMLTAVTLRRLSLGDAQFDRVPALVYEFAEITAHFGVRIDGVLGFPLFRDTLLTLDYPQSRLLLAPVGSAASYRPGARIAFDTTTKTPLIPITVDGQTLVALVDSGSDSGLNLNPVGLNTRFAFGPRRGGVVATLTGDHQREIGRLRGTLTIGNYTFLQPSVDLTDSLSSIGGSVLKNFVVTFDQARGDVTFFRESAAPLPPAPVRSSGLSFAKAGAYWRVLAVVPDSPAEAMGIRVGDLVTRIEGEQVERWPLARYGEFLKQADAVRLTFLFGRNESTVAVPMFELVPVEERREERGAASQ